MSIIPLECQLKDRLLAFLSTLFGILGTVLALVGIYGLISYAVTCRTREVGIRVSVGAQPGDVVLIFLRESLTLLAAGMLLVLRGLAPACLPARRATRIDPMLALRHD